MSIAWPNFVEQVVDTMATRINLDRPCARERDLTRRVAHGLRDLFTARYPIDSAATVHHHVTFRQGRELEDRKAWTAAKPDKWITVHGLRFVPDILIRRTLKPVADVLPIE